MNVDLRDLAIDRDPSKATRRRLRRHLLTRYAIPLLLVGGCVGLLAWSSRDLLFPPRSVTVVPVLVTDGELPAAGRPLFQAAGWVEPRPTPVRVAALAPGVVEQLLVVEDQPVQAGQPVAELVREDAELAYQRAKADLELRRAELEEAQSALAAAEVRLQHPVHLQAALSEADATLAKVDTQLEQLPFETRRAEAELEAVEQIYAGKVAAEGVVAGVQIDIAKSKLAAANSLVEELRNRSQSLQKERAALARRRDALKTQCELLTDEIKARDEARAKVRAAQARTEQAEVAATQARLQLDRMTVVSPIDGRVFHLIADPGARIGGGITHMPGYDSSTVVTLYRPDQLQVRVDVRFEDIPHIRLGQPVAIGNAALTSPLTGSVLYISSTADIQKNTLQVKVEIPEPPAILRPEMLVDVTFLSPPTVQEPMSAGLEVGGSGAEDAGRSAAAGPMRLSVPQYLIRSAEDGPFVWCADRSAGRARKQPIQTGSSSGDGHVEVIEGLNPTSRLIVTGTEELRDGGRIRVAGEASLEPAN